MAEACRPAVLAGGVNLVPQLRRLGRDPDVVVDVLGVPGWSTISVATDPRGRDVLRIGAAVRQCDVLDRARQHGLDGLAQAVSTMGTPLVRAAGTLVGALVHADPSLQLASLSAAAKATVVVESVRGQRRAAAGDLYCAGSLVADEVVTAVEFRLEPLRRLGFARAGRRVTGAHLGFAAATLTVAPDGTCREVGIGVSVHGHDGSAPHHAITSLLGRHPGPAELASAASLAAQDIRTAGDALASAAYRRHAIGVLVGRALEAAAFHALKEIA
jgi:carbon-monoxide dehydrogenase medium subunit